MADIIDEILNDVKDEKRLTLFRKSLPVIIITSFIITLCIAGYSWYSDKVTEHNRTTGDEFLKLVFNNSNAEPEIIHRLENIVSSDGNRQIELAEIKIVSELIAENKTQLAMEKLDSIINNKKYYDITTNFARLLWISLVLDQNNIPTDLRDKIDNYFQYFKDSKQPFFANATLLKALFYKKNAENNLALEQANILLTLSSDEVPESVKEQAKAIIANINRKS
ncbi:DUF2659 family protein [Rickettsiaceae bacterium]|nr:DUF2659 family protein [Rickettsiaceae bacterium]